MSSAYTENDPSGVDVACIPLISERLSCSKGYDIGIESLNLVGVCEG